MPDTGDLEISIDKVDNATVMRPIGDIDLARSPSLRRHLAVVLAQRPQRLVVDLSAVPYMDSSGVATLVEAMRLARDHRATLVLAALQSRVRSIFEIARLDMVFRIVGTVDEAVR
jgi:anti-sigma B factor antagonist